MDRFVHDEKSFCTMVELSFSSKLGCGPYFVSIAKIAYKKIGV